MRVEGDFDWGGNTTSANTINGVFIIRDRNDPGVFQQGWITTLAGRFGVTNVPGSFMQGWRRLGRQHQLHGHQWDDRRIDHYFNNNNTNSGWLAGAGIEWAFPPQLSVKIEYNYLGLNSQTFTVPTECSCRRHFHH